MRFAFIAQNAGRLSGHSLWPPCSGNHLKAAFITATGAASIAVMSTKSCCTGMASDYP